MEALAVILLALLSSCRARGGMSDASQGARELSGSDCIRTSALPLSPGDRRRHVISACPVGDVTICAGEIAIANDSFSYCPNITNVSLPAGLKTIGSGAFFACWNLQEISLPPELEIIDDYAFAYTDSLGEVSLPAGLQSIGRRAFRSSVKLKEISLPAGLSRIGDYAFAYCDSLEEVSLPAGLTNFGDAAFALCHRLEEVWVPAGVTRIGDLAFAQCGSLREVSLPAGLETIGDQAFSNCPSLQEVSLPAGLKILSFAAFFGSGLRRISLPASLQAISAYTFWGCRDLSEVTFQEPSNITRIGYRAFEGTRLSQVLIPESVMTIGNRAFADCPSLYQVVIPDALFESFGNRTIVAEGAFADANPGLQFFQATPCTVTDGRFASAIFPCVCGAAICNAGQSCDALSGACVALPPWPAPTRAPTAAPPTSVPTQRVTLAPTSSPPTSAPTRAPTPARTSASTPAPSSGAAGSDNEDPPTSIIVIFAAAAVLVAVAAAALASRALRRHWGAQAPRAVRVSWSNEDNEEAAERGLGATGGAIRWRDLAGDEQRMLERLGFECEELDGGIARGPDCCQSDEVLDAVKTDPSDWCRRAQEELTRRTAKLEEQEHSRSFWFVPREAILDLPEDRPIPRHQELRDSGMLVRRTVAWGDVINSKLAEDTAAVSHRWFDPKHPDYECVKLRKLKELLRFKPWIKFVWQDFMCVPQRFGGVRTLAELAEFDVTLSSILSYVFLGAMVVIFYEGQYDGRFWPSIESWMSTKTAIATGLVPSSASSSRIMVIGLLSSEGEGNMSFNMITSRWKNLNATSAIKKFDNDDFAVTKQSDKIINLKVLASIDSMIIKHFSESSRLVAL